jgi:DNA-directed RNA polymerase sigma subunit (sigma70/sigma32)
MGKNDLTRKRLDQLFGAVGPKLEQHLSVVTPLQRRILTLRFGLSGERVHSLEETRAELELSYERLRQEEAEAFALIRRSTHDA